MVFLRNARFPRRNIFIILHARTIGQRKILIWVVSIREKTRENKRKQEIVLWKIKIFKKCVDFDFWMWYNNIALE